MRALHFCYCFDLTPLSRLQAQPEFQAFARNLSYKTFKHTKYQKGQCLSIRSILYEMSDPDFESIFFACF